MTGQAIWLPLAVIALVIAGLFLFQWREKADARKEGPPR